MNVSICTVLCIALPWFEISELYNSQCPPDLTYSFIILSPRLTWHVECAGVCGPVHAAPGHPLLVEPGPVAVAPHPLPPLEVAALKHVVIALGLLKVRHHQILFLTKTRTLQPKAASIEKMRIKEVFYNHSLIPALWRQPVLSLEKFESVLVAYKSLLGLITVSPSIQ